MDKIIAGRFPSKKEADAVAVTMATIVEKEDICIFNNNAPGQHDALPLGGDENEDPDAKGADEDQPGAADRRPAGVMLSVRIGSPKNERLVISTLRKGHAKDIEQAQGTWTDGDWTDFDPVAAPNLVRQ